MQARHCGFSETANVMKHQSSLWQCSVPDHDVIRSVAYVFVYLYVFICLSMCVVCIYMLSSTKSTSHLIHAEERALIVRPCMQSSAMQTFLASISKHP